MRHRLKGRKFSRPTAQREVLLMSLARSLVEYEQIMTTLPKAKDLRPYVEKLLTVGAKGTLAARRQLIAEFRGDRIIPAKIMGELAERFQSRNGGYTRIVKAGFRKGDNAPMAIIEFLDRPAPVADEKAKPGAAKKAKSAADKKAASPVAEKASA